MSTDQRWNAAAAVVIAAAVGLRILALTTKSLWFDETYSIFVASRPIERLLATTAINDAHPPLYYLLLHVWMPLFGNTEGAVRALSVLIGAPLVLVTWLFGRRLIGPAPALIAAGFVAVAPAQVAMGQEARMYGLLALAALGSWWALWAAAAEDRGGGRRGPWVAYACTVAAMLYTHHYGFFVVASQAGYLVWRRTPVRVWRRWMYAGLGVLLLYLPWLPALLGQMASGRAWPTFRPPLGPGLYVDTLASLAVGRPIFEANGGLPLAVFWPPAVVVAALAAFGYRALANDREARALLVSSVLFPLTFSFAISYVVHVFAPRYLAFALPGLALLIGAGITATASARPRWVRIAGLLGLLVLTIPNVASLVRFYQQPRLDVFDWRKVSQMLAAEARPDDAIVFLPGFARIPVNYYFHGPQMRLALTPKGLDVVGPGGSQMSAIVAVLRRHSRVWILTVPPVPPSVDVLVQSLGQASYAVARREAINMARLILLERTRAP